MKNIKSVLSPKEKEALDQRLKRKQVGEKLEKLMEELFLSPKLTPLFPYCQDKVYHKQWNKLIGIAAELKK